MSRFNCISIAFQIGLVAALSALVSCKGREALLEAKLRDAYVAVGERPTALRLTTFPYLPPPSKDPSETKSLRSSLSLAARRVIEGGAIGRHTAVAHLLAGSPDKAVEAFDRELSGPRSNGQAWNDYAVALYELAGRTEDAQLLAKALFASDRSLRLSPQMPEAVCNRAAILEALKLRDAARSQWGQCTATSANRLASQEARSREAALQGPTLRNRWQLQKAELRTAVLTRRLDRARAIVRQFRQDARTWCEGELLAAWAEHHLSGRDGDAAKDLEVAAEVGNLLEVFAGERLLADSVAAARGRDRDTIDRLAHAHLAYRDGRIAIAKRQPSSALNHLERAEAGFRASSSPMALVALYYRAGASFDSGQPDRALTALDAIDRMLPPSYVALKAHTLWERSRIVARTGDVYSSLRLSRQATEIFQRLREPMHTARMQMANASSLAALGRPREAWQLRRDIFHVLSDAGSASEMERAMHTLALSELADGRTDTAAALLDVQLASPSELPLLRFESRLWRTVIATRDGDVAESNRQLRELGASIRSIVEPKQKESAGDDFRFAQAMLHLKSDPASAERALSETIAWRRQNARIDALPEAFVHRAKARRAVGDVGGAREDLLAALATLEGQRLKIHRNDLRDSFFASAETACNQLLDIEVLRGDVPSAFRVAERCRARGLVDALNSSIAVEPASLQKIQSRLDATDALIHYSVRSADTVAFVLTPSSLRLFVLPAGRRAIAASAEQRGFESLHRDLIAPLLAATAGSSTLLIVPDATLDAVPFCGLVDAATNQPLIQAKRVVLTPSATFHTLARRGVKPGFTNALVVGDPAFSRVQFTQERLPGAAREAHAVAAMYPRSMLLTGQNAQAGTVLSELQGCDIAHIATHALISSRDSELSVLLTADDGKRSAIYPGDVSALRLVRSPLIILAGCRTAVAGGGRGSIRGFASSFLAAGSRAVIATLWDIDDAKSARFARALHVRLLRGATPADALRETQLEMMRSQDAAVKKPDFWAAFQIYGAS